MAVDAGKLIVDRAGLNLQGHQQSLANLGDQADSIAATFTETENRSAATLKAVRCNFST